MSKSAMVRARIEPELKKHTEEIFEHLGLSVTQAITLFYKQVEVRNGFHFSSQIELYFAYFYSSQFPIFGDLFGCYKYSMKVTAYFELFRNRPDRAIIKDEWIERTVRFPEAETVQDDGRIRRWAKVEEMGGRYLRVVLLADGVTVHNAFFDRRFKP